MDTNPQPWPPYSRDCSRGICSYYCPQWCFFVFPPPPPTPPSPHPLLSPLLIAVIAIASTIFILIAYYIILAHYRRTRARARARASVALSDNPSWQATCRDGLDESLIERIAVCQYRAGGGLIVDGTDCSVCLSQFEDGDQIRLLPKCSHPFHLSCIDTWLKSNSTCPLCRAGIFPLPAPPNDVAINTTTTTTIIIVEENEESAQSRSDTETVDHELVEIREGGRVFGRSLSMDSLFRQRAEPNPNLDMNTDTDTDTITWSRTLHSILISPIQMKRSRSHSSILPT